MVPERSSVISTSPRCLFSRGRESELRPGCLTSRSPSFVFIVSIAGFRALSYRGGTSCIQLLQVCYPPFALALGDGTLMEGLEPIRYGHSGHLVRYSPAPQRPSRNSIPGISLGSL